jgi:hypothetical protein
MPDSVWALALLILASYRGLKKNGACRQRFCAAFLHEIGPGRAAMRRGVCVNGKLITLGGWAAWAGFPSVRTLDALNSIIAAGSCQWLFRVLVVPSESALRS